MRRARSRVPSVVVVVCSLITLAACTGNGDSGGHAVEAVQPVRALDLDFEQEAADLGEVVPGVTNEGTARVVARTVFAGGGQVTLGDGVAGGRGLRFPALDADADGQTTAAAVVVRSVGIPDVLTPGRRDFRFGADFDLDAASDGVDVDNGNNLLQRGLSADADQYKLQVDHGVPSCRVASADGTALVKSTVAVVPDHWYRVSCLRLAHRVVLTVAAWTGTRWSRAEVATAAVATGDLAFDDVDPPLAIGAKVTADGQPILSASDQFNGVVDNVHFELVP